jgi:hypothetical protein
VKRSSPASALSTSWPCSTSATTAYGVLNNPRTLRTIASKTGWVSAIALLIEARISPVALWRSSASLVSLKRRTFSIAITAWSAKV